MFQEMAHDGVAFVGVDAERTEAFFSRLFSKSGEQIFAIALAPVFLFEGDAVHDHIRKLAQPFAFIKMVIPFFIISQSHNPSDFFWIMDIINNK